MKYILKKEVIAPVITLIICILLCKLSKTLIKKIFGMKSKQLDRRKKTIINLISNIIIFLIIIICVLIILEIFGIDTKSIVASLSVVGVVIGLSIQDILKDFIAGISIVFEGQYAIGDWVTINGFKGEVLPSNLRTTKIKAYTGEIKIISNRNISEIVNYTLSKTKLLIDIDVDYNFSSAKVEELLCSLCNKLKDKYKFKDFTYLGIETLTTSSITYRLALDVNYLDQLKFSRIIKKEILEEITENSVNIPYKQVVVHNG